MSRLPTPQEDAEWSPHGDGQSRCRPLTSAEIEAMNNGTYNDGPTIDITQPEQRTELANAQRFIELHGDKLRYCPPWGKWLIWTGTHWQIDDGCQVEAL